jgi:hypothetical protein
MVKPAGNILTGIIAGTTQSRFQNPFAFFFPDYILYKYECLFISMG